ncbi:MAG: radical SAM protein [Candidatus Jordarchaeales archaeon]
MSEAGEVLFGESPEYVRVSLAAAITLGLCRGRFFRETKLYCLNLLLTYNDGCVGRCAYCGLSRSRSSGWSWSARSFIRVDWPVVPLADVVRRVAEGACPHVERACVSMITHRRAREDTLKVVEAIREVIDEISALISPTIVDRDWLWSAKSAGVDKVGVAVDAAIPELFEKLRGRGVKGPHKWEKYWKTVEESVDVFGAFNVGIHLIVGLGETEREAVQTIQAAYDMGALTHLFSFFPEAGSLLESMPQPPIGSYRRVQLARYLINKGISRFEDMEFDERGRITGFGVTDSVYEKVVESGLPFMTSGCSSKNRENACNRPFSDFTPYQAYIGEMRNYPFKPGREDVEIIKLQLRDYSDTPVKVWVREVAAIDE